MTTKNVATVTNPDFQYLDDEERELFEGFEEAWDNGHYKKLASEKEIESARASAQATIKASLVKVTTQVDRKDLSILKAKAVEQGGPYQSLLSSVVHRYAQGTLVDKQQ